MPVLHRRLDVSWTPAQMLRLLRDQPGLFGLVGHWYGDAAIVGWSPAYTLGPAEDPFTSLTELPAVDRSDRFGGGWVGAWGYQLGRAVERLPPAPPRPVPLADFHLAYYEHVLVRDADGWAFEALVSDANRARIERRLQQVRRLLAGGAPPTRPYACSDFTGRPGGAGHREAVTRTLEHLAAGDIFQANICRRFEADFSGDPLDAFCAGVERLEPQYAAFLRTSDGAIASFSPELFLHRRGRSVKTSPIKGTAALDRAVHELVDSAKNRAENVMIVDLMRNDLGRVCIPGSVRVEDVARAEQHTGVWHLVSDVVGELAAGADDADLLRATFPPGSVTGAPKVRAMEIIAEVEATGRETYTGAIGYVSPCAGLELNVAIRTFEFAGGRVWLGAGGGVVVDSTPHGELQETVVKAGPLVAAIGARVGTAEPDRRREPVAEDVAEPESASAVAELPSVDLSLGLFTTLLVRDGHPVDLEPHLARLGASLSSCYGWALAADTADRVQELAAGLRGRHRLRVTAVPEADRTRDPRRNVASGPQSTVAPELAATSLAGRSSDPWHLLPVVVPGGMGPHKYSDRRRLAAVEPAPGTWSDTCDALVSDCDGSILESGRGNLFVVTDDGVHTPAVDGRILPGVVRQRVLDELAAAGIPVTLQHRLTLDDLTRATEVFATSSLDGVRPVGSVVGAGEWATGPCTAWLQTQLLPAGGQRVPVRTTARGTDVRLLLIDNYDSFVYNLDQYVRELGARTHVVRNDATTVAEIADAVAEDRLHGIVISPGPGSPTEAGISNATIHRLGADIPILGVCLGHQCIAEVYGGSIRGADAILHGKQSLVYHDGAGVFAGLSGPLPVGRYHSLVVDKLPEELQPTAWTAGGVLMGLRHRRYDVEGVQFHPESVLTRDGHQILANFLHRCAERREDRRGVPI